MRLFIPKLGTKLKLTKGWEFDVYDEYRNRTIIDKYLDGRKSKEWGAVVDTLLFPIGTVLSIERIYIRSGLKSFNSVTFRVKSFPDEPKPKNLRFWVKLTDANTIECEVVE